MASRRRGTIYIGVTSALWYRVCDHKNKAFKGFTADYDVNILVCYQHFQTMNEAIMREKQFKAWQKEWKFRLIENMNPGWNDLHNSIDGIATLSPERDPSLRWGDGRL